MTTPTTSASIFERMGVYAERVMAGLTVNFPNGFTLIVKPTFLFLMSLAFLAAYTLLVQLAKLESTVTTDGEAFSLGPAASEPAALGFAIFYLVSVLVHELGHALAYRLQGMRWLGLELGFGAGVWAASNKRTAKQQLFITFLGPFLQVALCSLTLFLALPHYELLWLKLVAGVGLLEGAVNMLVPFSRKSDGSKLWRSLWLVLTGRGNTYFYGKA